VSKIKKTFIVIGATIILCAASFFTGLCISKNINSKRITELEQQLEQQITNYRELLNSARIGAEQMGRDIKTTRDLNRQLIEGLTTTRANTKADIERLRSAIDDSRRINEIIESAKSQD